jgi:hypothetical protein
LVCDPKLWQRTSAKDPLEHLRTDPYNSPLLDFFAAPRAKGG